MLSKDEKEDLADMGKNFDETSNSVALFIKKMASVPGVTDKAKVALTALKGALISNPIMAVATAIGVVVTAGIALHDKLTTTKKEVEDSYDKYKSLESELKEIGNEIENNNKLIDELQSKDSLTYIEKSQLEDLKEATKQLLIQQDVKEKESKNQRRQTALDSVDNFNQDYKLSKDDDEESVEGKIEYVRNSSILPQVAHDDIDGNISNYIYLKEAIGEFNVELEKNGKLTEKQQAAYTSYSNKLLKYESNINSIISGLQTNIQGLKPEYDYIISLGEAYIRTTDDNAIVNAYDEAQSLMQLIYSYYDPNKWNSIQVSSIFDVEGIEKTKEELIELSSTSGTLTPADLEKYPELNKAIEESNILFDDGSSKAQAFCNEINASVSKSKELEGNLKDIKFSDIFALENAAGTITPLGEANKKVDELQTAYTGLKEAMDSYNKTGYFTVDQVQDIISYGGEYLKYLVDENGNLKLNKEALDNVAIARLNEMRIRALSSLFDELDKITDETSAQAYLETQLYETSAAYDQLAESRINAWTSKLLESNSDITDSTMNHVTKTFENQAAAINELFDNVNINSFWNGDIEGATKDLLDKELALLDAQQEAGTISFQQYIDNRKSILKKYYDEAKITAAEYYSYLKETYEKQQNIYDKILNAVIRRFDKEIEKIDDTIESIEKENEALEKQLEQYDLLLSAVTYIFDEERDALEAEIESIDLKIENMQKANDELEKQIAYEQALDELYRARTQRTRYLYAGEGRGFIYTQDQESIREAEDKLSDLAFEKTIDNLEKEKDKIQEIIDKLNEVEEAWGKIGEAYDKNKAVSTAESILGKDYKDIILEGDPTVIQNFTNAYVSAQQKIDDNNSMIESWEEKKLVYDEMKAKWQEISDAYENSIEDQLAAQQWGADWENVLLADRGAMMEAFKNTYTANLQEIARIAEETAQREYDAALKAEAARSKMGGYIPSDTPEKDSVVLVPASGSGGSRLDKNIVYQKYHTGLEKGLVGKNSTPLSDEQRFKLLQRVARTDLKPDEIPAILQKGEAVMTPEQIRNVTDNLISASYGKILTIPNLPSSKQDVNITQHITITLPNVTNEGGYNKVVKEIQALQLVAYQNSFKR